MRFFFNVFPYFVLSENRSKPINHTKHPTAKHAIQNNRSGDRKNFAADSEYLSLLLKFNRRGGYGIGKTGDRDKASGTAESADFGIKITSCEDHTEKDQDKGTPGAGGIFVQPKVICVI